MASKWDGIKSRKIRDALRTALKDDKALSHSEVVEVVRSTLEDGILTGDELTDLNQVGLNSETMTQRSKFMLGYLVMQTLAVSGGRGPFSLGSIRQQYAANIICDFMKRTGSPYFKKLDRDIVGVDLLMRVANPSIINQQMAGLCGPVSFLYSVASDAPGVYAKFAIDLFEKGKAKIGRLEIEPGSDCRSYAPPASFSQAEWLTAASLRDSENVFLDFENVNQGFQASASTADMVKWFGRAGYNDVKYDDNLFWSRGANDIELFNTLYRAGYRIVLRINSKMLKPDKQTNTSGAGNHFIVLLSPITKTGETVKLTVFTWGDGEYQIPQGKPLSQSDFLGNLYGYVAGKPF